MTNLRTSPPAVQRTAPILLLSGPSGITRPMLRTTRLAFLVLSLLATGAALRLGASQEARGAATAGRAGPGTRSPLPHDRPALRYRIRARVDAATGKIYGQLALSLRNTSRASLKQLRFHLYLNAFASKETRFMRSSSGYHRGHAAGLPGWIEIDAVRVAGRRARAVALFDGTVAAVNLPKELRSNEGLEVAITFRAQLPQLFARTGRAGELLMGAQWYPKLGYLRPDGSWHCPAFHANSEFFAAFADYDVSIEVPPRYIVGATGERDARATSATPHRHHFHARWVHDFAFVAWPHFRRITRRIAGVEVELLTVPGRSAERQLRLIEFGLQELRRLFFPYPYPHLTVVDLPREARGAAAMEYPTLFTTRITAWTPPWLHAGDEITLHELVHQLFQGVVATNEANEPWLDEGLTTYISGRMLDSRFGRAESLLSLGPLRLGQRAKNKLHMLMAKEAPVGGAAADFPSWASYGANVYGRAASLFYTLESMIGAERVMRALGRYAASARFAHPHSALLERELIAHSPAADRAAVATLLEGVLRKGARLDARLVCGEEQISIERRGSLSLPLELHWRDHRGRHQKRPLPPKGHLTLPAENMEETWLGPAGRLSLDATPVDNHCRRADGRWSMALRYLPTLRQLSALVGP